MSARRFFTAEDESCLQALLDGLLGMEARDPINAVGVLYQYANRHPIGVGERTGGARQRQGLSGLRPWAEDTRASSR